MQKLFFLSFFMLFAQCTKAQQITVGPHLTDSLQQQIGAVDLRLDHVQHNLGKASQKMKYGILVASLGYSVTIAGGQMLGGKNNNLGEALLYTGGGIGLAGTFLLFDSFRFMRKASRQPTPKKLY